MKTALKVLAYLVGAILILGALLAGSVLIDALVGRSRIDALTNTTIPGMILPSASDTGSSASGTTAAEATEQPTAEQAPPVAAHVARPMHETSTLRPAVIMIHEFWGLQSSIVGKADALAEEGYIVVAPDTYRGAVTGWLPRAIYLSATTPTERVNADLDSVFAWLAAQPGVDATRIMVMGFCYGGGKALRYSLHNDHLAATGVFYGSLIADPAQLAALPGPVLGIFGAEDQSPTPAQVAEFEMGLEAAQIPHQITVYPEVGHAFLTTIEAIRQGGTQGAAWQEFLDFLDSTLRTSS
ncbi:MAG: dienelactone hydrolase family protein [Litorilinea sp.]